MGYAYRQLGDFANAERAFKKYIELIPNDPNPYDSYAELLMKMGRFDESIAQYRKALSIDEHFLNSHMGIAANLMYRTRQPRLRPKRRRSSRRPGRTRRHAPESS